jgi:polyhydroxyalkanoate synthesis regulator phasin
VSSQNQITIHKNKDNKKMTIDELFDRILTICECGLSLKKQEIEYKREALKTPIIPFPAKAPEAPAEEAAPEAEAPAEPEQAEGKTLSYDELKEYLQSHGVEVKPRTKYNTLVKMCDELVASGKLAEPETTVVEEAMKEAEVPEYTPEAPAEEAAPETPVAEAPAEPEAPASITHMTLDELRSAVGSLYEPGNHEHKEFLMTALKTVGVTRATDLKCDGDCEKVLAKFKELLKVA